MQAANQGTSVMAQGRIVWVVGKLFTGRPKVDFNTKAPKLDKQGNQQIEYGFGLAIPKSILNQVGPGQPGRIWTVLHEEAYKLFPSRQIPPSFAMKYKDGDGVDDKGIPFAQREGYAGHIVLACTTTIQPKFYRYENGQNIPITDGIKCGDYVDVQLVVKAHPAQGQGKAGLYVNPMAVRFLGYGAEIINTPSGDDIFGTTAPNMPQGASATPIAPQGFMVPPGQAQAPSMGQAQGGFPPAQQQGFGAPQAQPNYQPNYGVLPQAHQPQQQQQGYGQPAGNAAGFPPAQNAGATTPQQQGQFVPPAQASPGNPQTPQGFPQQASFPIPGQG